MNARSLRIPNYFVSLSLIALFSAALVADRARANLHPTVRATTAFEAGTEEYPESGLTAEAWCHTHRKSLYADFVTSMRFDPAGEFAHDAGLYRYTSDPQGRKSQKPYAAR
jgi:hypothetical protein